MTTDARPSTSETGTTDFRAPASSSAQHAVFAAADGNVIVSFTPSHTVLPVP